jgi:hypothetical protein
MSAGLPETFGLRLVFERDHNGKALLTASANAIYAWLGQE